MFASVIRGAAVRRSQFVRKSRVYATSLFISFRRGLCSEEVSGNQGEPISVSVANASGSVSDYGGV